MFDKLKQMKQLRDLKSSMEKEDATVEKQGVKVTVNGSMKVKSVELNSDLSLDEQQSLVKQCVNEAFQKVQQRVAQKMKEAQQ
ncbi:MAG: YbaB/EbfC family nucleoid-associated protein [Candidatus Paceibacterota bacterium]